MALEAGLASYLLSGGASKGGREERAMPGGGVRKRGSAQLLGGPASAFGLKLLAAELQGIFECKELFSIIICSLTSQRSCEDCARCAFPTTLEERGSPAKRYRNEEASHLRAGSSSLFPADLAISSPITAMPCSILSSLMEVKFSRM